MPRSYWILHHNSCRISWASSLCVISVITYARVSWSNLNGFQCGPSGAVEERVRSGSSPFPAPRLRTFWLPLWRARLRFLSEALTPPCRHRLSFLPEEIKATRFANVLFQWTNGYRHPFTFYTNLIHVVVIDDVVEMRVQVIQHVHHLWEKENFCYGFAFHAR